MNTWLLYSLALASSQPTPSVGPVIMHQTVSIEEAFVYTMRGDRPLVNRGTLLVFEATPQLLKPTQGRQPIVYVDEWPVRIYARHSDNRCAAGWVPLSGDVSDAVLFVGPDTLPERVKESQALQSKTLAQQPSKPPRNEFKAQSAAPTKQVQDERALAELAGAALRHCTT